MNNPVIYLAPFQGITKFTFHRVFAKHFRGIDKYYTPFFAKIDHDTRLSNIKLFELQHLTNGYPEVVPQILSNDADEIIRFAKIIESLGFKELNWNLGCPVPQVAGKKRGSGLLPYPALVDSILNKIMPAMPLRFSIKCRLGYESSDEIYQLLPVFNSYEIHELTVHGRIGRQLYDGIANNQMISEIYKQFKSTFVHNGDILTKDDFQKVSAMMPQVNHWMIGRGLLQNPFLAEELNGVTDYGDKKQRFINYLDDLYFAYRQDKNDRLTVLDVLKEYWDYLFPLFNEPQKVKRLIKKAGTFDEYEGAVKDAMWYLY